MVIKVSLEADISFYFNSFEIFFFNFEYLCVFRKKNTVGQMKRNFWVFINCKIENAKFEKQRMILREIFFQTKCAISNNFISKVQNIMATSVVSAPAVVVKKKPNSWNFRKIRKNAEATDWTRKIKREKTFDFK